MSPSILSSIADMLTLAVWLFVLTYASARVLDRVTGSSYAFRIKQALRDRYHRLAADTSPWVARGAVVAIVVLVFATGDPVLVLFALGMVGYLIYRTVGAVVYRPFRRYVAKRIVADGDYVLPFFVSENKNVGWRERFGNFLAVPKNRSTLILGTTRSGKTEVAKTLVYQMTAEPDEPRVVYDHKEDFQHFYGDDPDVLRISSRGSTVTWNLFLEVEREEDFDELGRALFPGSDGGNQFFDDAKRQVFVSVLKMLWREVDHDDLSNKKLVDYFRRRSREEIYEDITEHDDLVAAATALDPDASRQSVGVFASVQQRVSDVFVGDFAAESPGGGFSVREYMADPRGRTLILDYPNREGDSVKPIFRFLLDHAAMHALADRSNRGAYFVLDEFARIPGLRRIGDLVNVGAGRGINVLVTLQSVAQLYDNYGRDRATAILSGLVTQVILRLQDDDSIEYARNAIGTEFNEYTKHVDHGQQLMDGIRLGKRRETKLEEEHHFAQGEFSKLDPGEGFVIRPGSWALGYAPRLVDGYDMFLADVYHEVEQEAINDAVANDEPYPWDEDEDEDTDPTEPAAESTSRERTAE